MTAGVPRPCIRCGAPSLDTRCADCYAEVYQPRDRSGWNEASATERGYDYQWKRLSARARRLQKFCTDCGSNEHLQADHTPEAWARKAAGKPIRLCDIAVVCRRCNNKRGPARGPRATRVS
jgi:hypothetical protein